MKKIFCTILCTLMLGFGLVGCGDEEYYAGKTAIICLDGTLIAEGKLEKVQGWSNGTCTVTIDGVVYQTHTSNVVIIADISKGE